MQWVNTRPEAASEAAPGSFKASGRDVNCAEDGGKNGGYFA